jgi:hypothetical protein
MDIYFNYRIGVRAEEGDAQIEAMYSLNFLERLFGTLCI